MSVTFYRNKKRFNGLEAQYFDIWEARCQVAYLSSSFMQYLQFSFSGLSFLRYFQEFERYVGVVHEPSVPANVLML